MSEEKQLYLTEKVKKALPSMVRNELAKLPAQKQEEFNEEFQRKMKSTSIGYALWFFLGMHYLYLGKVGLWIIFWITFGGVGVWWLIDAFRLNGLIEDQNKDIATDLMRNLKAISA
jgi:TM2 domain-containing membrane protein YozV